MSSPAKESAKETAAAVAAQQSDNVAHALAGAGGGLLSMTLTYVGISYANVAIVGQMG
jgi:solute carrier family 25 (peroxisomal adenine nucleotide transporter), member 17